MLRFFFLFTITIFSFSTQGKVSYISKTQTLDEKGYELLWSIDYFQPSLHSNEEGTLISKNEGESYQTIDLNFLGSYGFTSRLEMSIGLRGRYILSTEQIGGEKVSFTRSGLESGSVRFKYSFPMEEGIQYSIEANYRAAFYTNPEYNITQERTEIVLGEGGTDVSLGLGVTYLTANKNFFSGRFLYRNPAEHLSSEIYSEIEYALSWPSITLVAGVENIYSLNQDPYATDPNNKPAISSGSTYLYNSINRSWTAPYLSMNIATRDRGRFEFKVSNRMQGISTDLGNIYTFNYIKRVSSVNSFATKDSVFKEYKYEGSVTKITPNRTTVVIDMGIAKGIAKGDKVDFYHFDYLGGNQLIASGVAVKVGLAKSIVKITGRYSKLRVEEGTMARSGLIKD